MRFQRLGQAAFWRVNSRDRCWDSRIAFVAHFLGKELAYTYEVHELDPGKRLAMCTDEGPFPMETTYVWEDTASGARG